MTPTVEQSDRDAAANIQFRPNTPLHDAALEGDLDHTEEVQAFARHRIAALEAAQVDAMRSRIERLEEALRRIRKISSKPTYPGNNCRDIDSIAIAALGDDG